MRSLGIVNSIINSQKKDAEDAESEILKLLLELQELILELQKTVNRINFLADRIVADNRIVSRFDTNKAAQLENDYINILKKCDSNEPTQSINKVYLSINKK